MFKSYILLLASLCAAAMAMAVPISPKAPVTVSRASTAVALNRRPSHRSLKSDSNDKDNGDDSKYHGRGTWFSDHTGSCETGFDQHDMIVAMNEDQMGAMQGSNSQCGKTVRVHYGGKSVDVKVVDTCPSQYCDHGALDLSQAAFKKLAGGLSKGVLALTWEFV